MCGRVGFSVGICVSVIVGVSVIVSVIVSVGVNIGVGVNVDVNVSVSVFSVRMVGRASGSVGEVNYYLHCLEGRQHAHSGAAQQQQFATRGFWRQSNLWSTHSVQYCTC